MASPYVKDQIDAWLRRWIDHHLFSPKQRPRIDQGQFEARAYIAQKNGWGAYSYGKALKGYANGLSPVNKGRERDADRLAAKDPCLGGYRPDSTAIRSPPA